MIATDQLRRLTVAAIEIQADHTARAGRDLFLFGLMAGAYALIGRPDLPGEWLLFLKLCAPAGCVAYLVALYLSHRLYHKAQRLASASS